MQMTFFRLIPFLFFFLFSSLTFSTAQVSDIKRKPGRLIRADSIQQKLKRLADSIYQLNGGKPAIPPESVPAPATVPQKEAEIKTTRTGKGFPLYWVAGGGIILMLSIFWLTRKRKG